jgi:hypothetical protein
MVPGYYRFLTAKFWNSLAPHESPSFRVHLIASCVVVSFKMRASDNQYFINRPDRIIITVEA